MCGPVSIKVSPDYQDLDKLNVEGFSGTPELTLWRSHLSHFYLSVSILLPTRLHGPLHKVKLSPPQTPFLHHFSTEKLD